MKIAIFHPQIEIFGGGEIISLTIASILLKNNEVHLYTPSKVKIKELENFFGLPLSNLKILDFGLPLRFLSKIPVLSKFMTFFYVKKIMSMKGYDLIIDTSTNGMFYKTVESKTLCYINFKKFPKLKRGWKSIVNIFLIDPGKAFQYDRIISNSEFTRKEVKEYSNNKNSVVINPPVFVEKIKPKSNKKNYILTVGRLTSDKKIEIMIQAFKLLFDKTHINWEFHIIGIFRENVDLYKKEYYDMLKSMAKGYPIVFHENMEHDSLLKFIAICKIYWHARGYGEKDTDEYENFGITTVEAMAAGCVPVVINLGAQPEIVEHGKNGFVWNEPEELIKYTIELINSKKMMNTLSKEAIRKSKQYDSKIFEEKLIKIIDGML